MLARHRSLRRCLSCVLAAFPIVVAASSGCGSTGASPSVDAGAADASVEAMPTGNAFGEPCLKNSDCLVDVCLASGKCSKSCSGASDCPPGPEWLCGSGGICSCTPSGPEICDGRDNDCDGVVDDGATCGQAKLSCQNGVCACKPSDVCGKDCFDLDADPQHCGACGNVCPSSCAGGSCSPLTQIVAGMTHACVRVADGAVRCWGGNAWGQIGDSTNVVRGAPVAPLVGAATRIAARAEHTCAIVAGGLSCWGEDSARELVSAPIDACEMPAAIACLFHPTAVALPVGLDVADVVLGARHMCVLGKDGTVSCAGDGSLGQLGDGSTQSRSTLAAVPGLTAVKAIAAAGDYTCALLGDTTLRCWGANGVGQCGDGTAGGTRATPVAVQGLSTVVAIATGPGAACAILVDGTLRCWGGSSSGELGQIAPRNDCNINYRCMASPVAVPGVAGVTGVSIGRSHACARLGDGSLQCWGSNDKQQLGYTTTEQCLIYGNARPCSTSARPVPGIAGAIESACGDSFTCARLAGTDVRCWGQGDSGQLGDGAFVTRMTPGAVTW